MTIEQLYKHYQKHPSVSTDTRKINTGDIFFALKGENFNGNQYAKLAIEKGASLAVVDEHVDLPSEQVCNVEEVLTTLQKLANFHRKSCSFKIIALTGSNGKTTTKELVHAVLSTKYKVQSTPGNFNNHIGVPLTLLGILPNTEFAIVEMGDNHSGEIAELCEIAEPDYGLITNVGKDHLEGFGSMEANIAAKGELFDFLQKSRGYAFLNTDDKTVLPLAQNLKKIIRYNAESEPQLKEANPYLILLNGDAEFSTHLAGLYNLENIRTAWQIGKHFNINDTQIAEAISAYVPKNNRSQVIQTPHNLLILDAYNANPSSVEAALESFASAQLNRPKAIILGDMFELGAISEEEHTRMIALTKTYNFDRTIFCGPNYSQHKNDSFEFYNSKEDLQLTLEQKPLKGFAVLLKGSRGIALETLEKFL